jgi:hypothetical protein
VQVCKAIDAYLFSCQDLRVNHLSANFNWFREAVSLFLIDVTLTVLCRLHCSYLIDLYWGGYLWCPHKKFSLKQVSYSLILFKVWLKFAAYTLVASKCQFRHQSRSGTTCTCDLCLSITALSCWILWELRAEVQWA